MIRSLKYWVVAIAGALFVTGAVVATCLIESRPEEIPSTEARDFAVEDRSSRQEGNSSAELDSSTAEKVTLPPETTERTTETSAEETTNTTEAETTEEETEPEEIYGLRAYFEHKLIVDPSKTEKYLNVREEPNDQSDILSVLYPCEMVEYYEVKNNWYKIWVDEECYGYVSGDYVLADREAYEAGRHHVGYRVMCRNFDTIFYEDNDPTIEGILSCDMGETFAVTGIMDGFYRVVGRTSYYPVLYVECKDVLLYYVYLGSEQTNGLEEDMEDYLAGMDLTGCEEAAEELAAQAVQEKSRLEAAAAAEAAAREEALRQAAEAKARARQEAAKANGLGISEANVANVNLSSELTAYTLNLCAQYGVDSAVIFAVMYQESRFDPNCTSASGAIGLMQIVPRFHSARMQSLGVTDLYDPSSNILVGIDLLADYYNQEGGDWVRALTRYRYGVSDGSADYANLIFSYVPMFQ